MNDFPSGAESIGMIELTTTEGAKLWVVAASIYAIERNPSENFTVIKTMSEPLTVVETPDAVVYAIHEQQQISQKVAMDREERNLWRELDHDMQMGTIREHWSIDREADRQQLRSGLRRALRAEVFTPEVYRELGLAFGYREGDEPPQLAKMPREMPTLADADPAEPLDDVIAQDAYDKYMGVDPDASETDR